MSQNSLINYLHKPPVMYKSNSMCPGHHVTVETFQFSPEVPLAYEGSYSTTSAILIAIFLVFSVPATLNAKGSSLAGKIIVQKAAAKAALIPLPHYTPDKVVRIQLEALANNDMPYQDAGIEVAFRFASPANKQTTGPLSRFIQLVHNPIYNPMLDHQTAHLGDLVVEDARAFLPVFLAASDGKRVGYLFILSKQAGGAYDQCWMTDAVLRLEITSA